MTLYISQSSPNLYNTNVNYGLQLKIINQNCFINCDKCSTLMEGVSNKETVGRQVACCLGVGLGHQF